MEKAVNRNDYPFTMYINFKDEAPRIGSGHRRVEVLSVGPKWAVIRYKKGGIYWVKHKFKREDWDRIYKLNFKKESNDDEGS